MKILHLLNHAQKSGNGIVNVAVDLACLQSQQGHSVVVVSGGGGYESLFQEHGVEHYTLDQTRTPVNLISAAFKFRQILQRAEPEIIHAHMMTGVVLASSLRAGHHYSIVATVHNEFQRSSILMGLADRVIAVSEAVYESMKRRGIPAHKLNIVRNATIGSPRVKPLNDYQPLPLCNPSIVTVAGMNRRKGISEVIDAFSQISDEFPEAHLYLVGDGPDRNSFERMASEKTASSRIKFEGFQAEPQRYLLSTDIFVLASHQEPFGLAVAEAREVGCAIVASQTGGIPEVLDGGRAGLLVRPGSVEDLADSFRRLLGSSDRMQEMKTQSRSNLAWLHVKRLMEETMDVYSQSLVERSK